MPDFSLNTMAWIAGVGLTLYLGGLVYAIAVPRKQRDPHDGMAVGCLLISAVPGIILAIVLAIGVWAQSDAMIRWPFYLTVSPMAYLLVMGIAIPIMKWHKKRNEWPADAEQDSSESNDVSDAKNDDDSPLPPTPIP